MSTDRVCVPPNCHEKTRRENPREYSPDDFVLSSPVISIQFSGLLITGPPPSPVPIGAVTSCPECSKLGPKAGELRYLPAKAGELPPKSSSSHLPHCLLHSQDSVTHLFCANASPAHLCLWIKIVCVENKMCESRCAVEDVQ